MKFWKMLLGSLIYGYRMSIDDGEGGPADDVENLNDVPDDQLDDEAFVAKRGAKNVREELTRSKEERAELKTLREKLAKLEAAPAPKADVPAPKADVPAAGGWKAPDGESIKYPAPIQRFYDKMMAKGYDKDWIQGQCDMSFYTTSEAISHSSKLFDDLKPVQQDMYDRKLDKIIAGFKEEKNTRTKLISTRFAKEVEDEFKKLDVKKWGDKEEQAAVISRVESRHDAELNPGGSDELPPAGRRMTSDTGGAGGGAGGGAAGLSEDDIMEAAIAGDLDLGVPAERKAAIDLARVRKERDKNRTQFIS